MTNKVIGIISYFPDDEEIHQVRLERLKDLIQKCNTNFNLPFIIVAQNWTKSDVMEIGKATSNKINLLQSSRLGITGAREALRQCFLKLDFDYMICFDDDFELNENVEAGQKYLGYINQNSKMIIEQDNYLMNFLGMPKWAFLNEAYDLSINVENLTGYEDWIYLENLKYKYQERYVRMTGNTLIKKKRAEMVKDKFSTWKPKDLNEQEMTRKCWKIIVKNKLLADKWRKNHILLVEENDD